MNNLKNIREELNISAHALCFSLGEPAPVSVRTYNAVERGVIAPTLNTAKNILALININRTEQGKPDLALRDLCISGIG